MVAENTLRVYDGYWTCPLTVERAKIVLAEFGYGGKVLPTFPFLDGKAKPARVTSAVRGAFFTTNHVRGSA